MPFQDFYEILGLTQGEARVSDLKAAYKKEAMKVHPDRNFGDPKATEKFQALGRALEILEDPTKRQRYQVRYAEYQRQKVLLKPMLERRRNLRQESSELQELWVKIQKHEFPRWGEWEDYVGFGGGDDEIEEAICAVLDKRMEKVNAELEAARAAIVPLQERMDNIPVQ